MNKLAIRFIRLMLCYKSPLAAILRLMRWKWIDKDRKK